MNSQMFINLCSQSCNLKTISEAIRTTDLTGTILRIHLACEELIDIWIFSAVNNERIFNSDDDRLFIDFFTKLKIAKNLGLPKSLFNVFREINRIRNKFAHNVTHNTVPEESFSKIIDNLNNCKLNAPDGDAKTFKMTYNIIDGESIICTPADNSAPIKYRLAALYMILLRKISFISAEQGGAF